MGDGRGGGSGDRVTIAIDDGVADVRLNRPEKLNALDLEMFDALGAVIERLGADRDVRAVVVSGEGRAFSAGLDLAILTPAGGRDDAGPDPDAVAALFERADDRVANRAQQAAWGWVELAVPVIAAVHGVAFGGGMQIALGADLRFVTPDVSLALREIRWGLVPDMAGTHLLPRLVGPSVAQELMWTGRSVHGEEAVALGLANRVCDDPRADALALAATLANEHPGAVAAAKRLVGQSPGVDARRQLVDETAAARRLLGGVRRGAPAPGGDPR